MAVVFCNNNIDKVMYSGYTIDKIYTCGGELVYGVDDPTVPPQWKEKFEYNDGSVYYGGANFSTSGNVAYSDDYTSYVYTYNGTRNVYEYSNEYKGTSAIQNNVSALTINSGITTISANTFSGCTSLVSAMKKGCCITTIGNSAFRNCSKLEETNLTYSVTTIEAYAFHRCSKLKEVILNDIVSIGNLAFYQCDGTSFWRLSLPATIQSIGIQSFAYCSNLRVIICNAITPPTIDFSTFSNCHSDLKIYVPDDSVNTYKTTYNWSDYASKIYPMSSMT